MASLEVHKKYYVVVFSNRGRSPRRKKLYFKKKEYTKTQVKQLMHDLETRYKTGDYDPWVQAVEIEAAPFGMNADAALDEFVSEKSVSDWRDTTAHTNRVKLYGFRRIVEGLVAEELTAAHVNRFINRGGIKYETRKSDLRLLVTFCRWANKKGYTTIAIPDIKIQARSNQQARIKYVSYKEQRILEQHIYKTVRADIARGVQTHGQNSMWLIDFLRWQRMSGMRISETLSLKVSSIDWDSWDVRIGGEGFQTKSGEDQVINIAAVHPLKKIALRWKRKQHHRPDASLFGHISDQNARLRFRRYRNEALPHRKDIKIHTFRHSCAIDLCRAGVDIYRVKRWLRHKDIATTMLYADLVASDVSAEIGRVFNEKS